jgi:DNA-binding response OmpR family regulator
MLQLSESRQDNIAAYIGKPFGPDTLLNTVKAVLVAYKDVLLDKNRPRTKPWEATPVSPPLPKNTLTKAAEIGR